MRLTLSFLIVICFAGLIMASGAGEQLKIADFVSDPRALPAARSKLRLV